MLVDGIVSYLNANAQITSTANSIQPIPAPPTPSDYPCVTFQVASDVSEYGVSGLVHVTQSRVIFTCIAQQYADARTLALAIKSLFTGFIGSLPDGTVVLMTEVVNMLDGFDDGSRMSTIAVHTMFTYSD
jgi:hypothetical protein